MLRKTDHQVVKFSSIFVKIFLATISKRKLFLALVYIHAITPGYNARIHMIDLRMQEILIEIDVEKSFVMKYVMNGYIQFTTIVNTMTV